MVIPVQIGMTQGVGARKANLYTLPSPQRNEYDSSYIYMKRNYGRIKIDGFSIASSEGKNAWVSALTLETKSVADSFALMLERQAMSDGRGALAYVNGAISGQIITVDTPGGLAGDTPEVKWFKKNQVLDIYNAAGAIHANSVVVSVVDAANKQITVVGTITAVVDNDIIYLEDTYSAADAPNDLGEMMGIRGIISDANAPGDADFQGINRTGNDCWKAYVKPNVGILTETKIQEALDEIEGRTDAEAPRDLLMTFALRNKLLDIVKADRIVSGLNLVAGWEAIKYRGGSTTLTIMAHKHTPVGTMYFLTFPHISFYVLRNMTWDNKGGGIIKPVAGEDAYEAWFSLYSQIGTDMPNSMGVYTGVTTSA